LQERQDLKTCCEKGGNMPKTQYNPQEFLSNKYGRWTPIRFSHMVRNHIAYWVFRCDCGKEKAIERTSVIRGSSTSCGCVAKDLTSKRAKIHGHAKTDTKPPSQTYNTWASMVTRCEDPRWPIYADIKLCERWKTFTNFLEDMGVRPKNKTIDRIDSSKGYYKENCRWATKAEQSRNTRKTKKPTSSKYRGVTWIKNRKKWRASSRIGSGRVVIGHFENEAEAALAYNEIVKVHHGEFAILNKVEPTAHTNSENTHTHIHSVPASSEE
jgi:hypothetical protein